MLGWSWRGWYPTCLADCVSGTRWASQPHVGASAGNFRYRRAPTRELAPRRRMSRERQSRHSAPICLLCHGGAGSWGISALCILSHFPDSLGLGRFSGCESHTLSAAFQSRVIPMWWAELWWPEPCSARTSGSETHTLVTPSRGVGAAAAAIPVTRCRCAQSATYHRFVCAAVGSLLRMHSTYVANTPHCLCLHSSAGH